MVLIGCKWARKRSTADAVLRPLSLLAGSPSSGTLLLAVSAQAPPDLLGGQRTERDRVLIPLYSEQGVHPWFKRQTLHSSVSHPLEGLGLAAVALRLQLHSPLRWCLIVMVQGARTGPSFRSRFRRRVGERDLLLPRLGVILWLLLPRTWEDRSCERGFRVMPRGPMENWEGQRLMMNQASDHTEEGSRARSVWVSLSPPPARVIWWRHATPRTVVPAGRLWLRRKASRLFTLWATFTSFSP
jgi:hypothetical protein